MRENQTVRVVTFENQDAAWLWDHLQQLAIESITDVEASLIRRLRNAVALSRIQELNEDEE